MFKLTDAQEKLMRLQVTQYQTDSRAPWTMAIKEAALYCDYLPSHPKTILDLGCGLGRTTVMLHRLYGCPKNAHYWMLDGDRVDKHNDKFTGGWMPEQSEWCCNLMDTLTFLLGNKVFNAFFRNMLVPDPLPKTLQFDLVISTLAVGFHWPIEPWLDKLLTHTVPGCVLIFGVREGKYNGAFRHPGYETVALKESGWKENFLILARTDEGEEGERAESVSEANLEDSSIGIASP